MNQHLEPWDLTTDQSIPMFVTLGILIIFYTLVIYFGGSNSYNYLYKEMKYKIFLMSAFYVVGFLTCLCRII